MSSLDPPPSQEEPDLFDFVYEVVDQRLDQFKAWPANIFKLELESSGIYQNFSGRCLLELLSNGVVDRKTINGYPYMARPGTDPSMAGTQVREATEKFYDLPNDDHKPTFAELALYVALAREKELLDDDVQIDILPKGHYTHQLRGIDNEVDGLLHLNQEYFPLQIYNGIQLITLEDANGRRKKVKQAEKVSTEEDPPSNPALVSHLTSEEVRNLMRDPHNGTVIDLRKLIACKKTNPNLLDALKFLNIRNRVEFIPRLETSYGFELDGQRFDWLVDEYPNTVIPRKVAPAATQLPDRYRQIVRGALHLLYVNTFYRRANNRREKEAGILLQEAFHHLLRSQGMDVDQFIDEGWDEFEDRYDNIKFAKEREPSIRDTAREYVSTLVKHNVMTRRGDTIYARNSSHPHTSLSFPSGFKS